MSGRSARQASLAAFGVGALLVVYGAWQWWDGERTFARMRETSCTVLSRTIESNLLVMGKRNKTLRYRDEAHLALAHTLEGREFTFVEDFVRDWSLFAQTGIEEGKAYPCRYDPLDPRRGTIRRAFDPVEAWETLALGLAAMMVAVAIPWWRSSR